MEINLEKAKELFEEYLNKKSKYFKGSEISSVKNIDFEKYPKLKNKYLFICRMKAVDPVVGDIDLREELYMIILMRKDGEIEEYMPMDFFSIAQ